MKLNATVYLTLHVPDTTDPGKITTAYLTNFLDALIEKEPPGTEPFAVTGLSVMQVIMEDV